MKIDSKFILLTTCLFFISTSFFWISRNNLPPPWDQAQYLEAAEKLYVALRDESLISFLEKTTTVLTTKAPLMTILPIPLYFIFGSSPLTALTVNILFMFVFYIFFYKLIILLGNKPKIAIYSILIISTMPLFYGLVRYFFVEFGLMTIVTIWIYLLIKTNGLSSNKFLFLLGITSALGMLMKFHFFIFITGPLSIYLYNIWRKKHTKFLSTKNIFTFLLPATLISLPWYVRNLDTLLWKALRSSDPEILGDSYYGGPFTFSNIYFSALDFTNFVISPYWLFIIVTTVVILFLNVNRNKIRIESLLLGWFLIPFLIFFLGPNKDYRLMLPLLPPVAIFVAKLLDQVLPNKMSTTAFVFLTVFPIFIYINTNILNVKLFPDKINFGNLVLAGSQIGNYVNVPDEQNWPVVEVLTFIDALDNNPKIVTLAYEDRIFNINTLKYLATYNQLDLSIETVSYFAKNTDFDIINETINKGDYLVMKTGGVPGPEELNRFNDLIIINLDQDLWKIKDHDIKLPDGGEINIWQKVT